MNHTATVHTSDGHQIFVRSDGVSHDKAPLVCLPGLTRNSRDFTTFAERYSSETSPHRRLVLRIDFRGRGRSSVDYTGASYETTTYARDVVEVLDTFGVDRAVLVGTSLGGSVAMVVNATHPNRVAGVVLNDVGPRLEAAGFARIQSYAGKLGNSGTWDLAMAQVRMLAGALGEQLPDQVIERLAREQYHEFAPGEIRPDHDPGIVAGLDQVDPHALPTAWPLFDALADTPTLVVRGADSDLFGAATLGEMHLRKSDLQSVTVANRGHCPFLDEPEVSEAMDWFLSTVDGGNSGRVDSFTR